MSVDDHVVEPAHVWQDRLPERHRGAGPRIERHRLGPLRYEGGIDYRHHLDPADGSGEWGDVWILEGRAHPLRRHEAAAGLDVDDLEASAVTFDDMRPGCHDPVARIADMAADHVAVSMSFPTFAGSCGQRFLMVTDRELGLACVRAYNDWMIDEWCAGSNGALVPLGIVPLWDAALAAAEVRRNAERGCRAVSFCEIPSRLALPGFHSFQWEPFFAACAETGTTICIRVESVAESISGDQSAQTGNGLARYLNPAMVSLADWLFSGVLARHPDITLAYSEGRIGWLVHVLERADGVWAKSPSAGTRERVPEPPSHAWRRHGYVCLGAEERRVDLIDRIGVDNVTFATDYPRPHGTWPATLDRVERMFTDVSDEVTHKVLQANASRMLAL